ncbi:GNAT family N-acetyltransferase [Fervidobacterium riparium]|uniref:GNAT family N-acetyltransferase n=1 Tax=Fervidobacterium gondwanense TaxID=44754 RepID=UPI002208527A|nr:GCN5 family acetyltransferase [Fervidobacterium riparium]
MADVLIREAQVSDADVVSSLILETGQSFLPLLFGPYVKVILGRLIKTPGTVYSVDNIYVLEVEKGKVVGMIVAFAGNTIMKRAFKTGIALFRIMGFDLIRRLPSFRLVWMRNKISRDEFYISNIAVSREYRGMGYGKRLMEFAEELAKRNNFKKISLDVENTNKQAIDLYKKLGYIGKKVNRVTIRNQKFTFVRMEKALK